MADFKVKGTTQVFDSTKFGDGYYAGEGNGSIWTVVASGSDGQTATISGSMDSVNWVVMAELVVGALADWATIQHTFPYLRSTGSAVVRMSRGAA